MTWITRSRRVFDYRDMILNLIRRDLIVRYQRSLFGVLMEFLIPVIATSVFSLLFSRLMPGHGPAIYPFQVFIGYIVWDYFARTVALSTEVLLGHASLIGKVPFPLEVLPLGTCSSALVQLLIGLILFVPINGAFGSGFHATALLVPFIIIVQFVLVAGTSLFVSGLCALFRDLAHLVTVLLAILFWATPIFYSPDIVPYAWARTVLDWNPLYQLIRAYRAALIAGETPDPAKCLYAAAWAAALFGLGSWIFDHLRRRVTEEIQ